MDTRRSQETIYADSLRLVFTNPVLLAPASIVLLSIFALAGADALLPKIDSTTYAFAALGILIIEGVAAVVLLLRMCGAAWRTGRVSLRDAASSAYQWTTDIIAILSVGVIWSVVDAGIRLFAGAGSLSPSTPREVLGLVMLVALNLLLLYVPISVVIGRFGPIDALRDSAAATLHHFGRTLFFVIVLTVGMFPFWQNGGQPPSNVWVLAFEFAWIAIFGTYMLTVLTGQYAAFQAAGSPTSGTGIHA